MKIKIKLLIVGIITIFGLFANVNMISAQSFTTTCNGGTTTTTINGYLGLNGSQSASVWFEWGPTQSLGSSTTHQTFTSDSNFSQLIYGLVENTTYYYRAMGSNDSGTETGDIKSFVTICSVANPTVSLTADNSNITYNGNTTMRWTSNNATSCTASGGTNGWSGNKSTSGTFNTGSLTNNTTYNIVCTNGTGSANDSVTVNVNNQVINQPSVSTNNATNITSSSATLNGVVNGNGLSTTAWFEYGTNTNFGYSTPQNSYGSGFSSYSAPISGLTPNTTYYFRAVAQSSQGIIYGSTLSFTTIANFFVNTRPTVTISTDQANISFGGSTFIRWNTTNATSCTANGGSVGWAGPKSIGPGSFYTGSLTANTIYAITCSNSFESTSNSVLVTVRPQIITTTITTRPAATSLVLITSSVDKNQPIVPTLDNTNPCPGDEITYNVTYQNIGNASITHLTLRLDLPPQVDYMFSNPSNPIRSGQTLIFNLGTLKANAQGTVTARVRVRDNTFAGTNLNFPATLSYTDPAGFPQSVAANVSANVCGGIIAVNLGTNVTNLGANVFGAGFLPASVFGWLLLLILILILVLLGRYLFGQSFTKKTTTTFDQPLGKKTTTTIEQ